VPNSPCPIQPFLSVVIPIYNGAEDVLPLLNCLRGQTYARDRVEYLLVDNNSNDGTAEHLLGEINRANGEGFQFRYCLEREIQSAYAARNNGIRAAHHNILVFTDADCRPRPDWLSELVQPFAEEAVGLVVGEIVGAQGHSWLEDYASHMDILSQTHTLAHDFAPYGQTANLAVRMAAFAEVGLFRPFLTTGGDADMCWRIQQGGDWRLAFAEAAVVEHCHRTTLAALRSQWQRYGRSNCYLHALHGIPLMQAVTPARLLRGLLHWLLKELPRTTWQWIWGRQPAIALVAPLVALYCGWFRFQGQQSAQLPLEARAIEWLGVPMDQSLAIEQVAAQMNGSASMSPNKGHGVAISA
jgi:cellulose synthase/poly-beta-1,6-N-acetylglucosamine synthase-like glycosyltransferase